MDVYDRFPDIRDKYGKLNNEIEKQEFIKDIIEDAVPKGGKVQCNVPGTHKNICCLDVRGMYPSLIITFNLCPSTWVNDNKVYKDVKYINLCWTQKDNRLRSAKFVCDFHERKIKGLLPIAVSDLLERRAKIKGRMKALIKKWKESREIKDYRQGQDRSEWKILNAQQGQVKKLCNSCYGALLYPKFPLYIPDIGGAITQKGREYIIVAGKTAEKEFGLEIVYGDTDSIFTKVPESIISKKMKNPEYNPNEMTFQNINPMFIHKSEKQLYEEIWDLNEMVSERINELMIQFGAGTMNIDVEKIFKKIHIFKKKKYAGLKCESRDLKKVMMNVMGIDIKKRNSSEIERYIGQGVLDILLSNEPAENILIFFKQTIKEIYTTDKFGPEYFVKSSKFKGFDGYKNPDILRQCRAVKIIEEIDPGNLIMAGDRVRYTYRKNPIKIGSRGGINFPKKIDQVYPFDYIDRDPNFQIDYVTFILYSVNTFEDILMPIIDVSTKKDVRMYFLGIIMKYDKIFNLQMM
jgi:DNA polymerase elongation subunit (family B)